MHPVRVAWNEKFDKARLIPPSQGTADDSPSFQRRVYWQKALPTAGATARVTPTPRNRFRGLMKCSAPAPDRRISHPFFFFWHMGHRWAALFAPAGLVMARDAGGGALA